MADNLSNEFIYHIISRDRFTCQCCQKKTPNVALYAVPKEKEYADEEPEYTKYITLCQECKNKRDGVPVPTPLELFQLRSRQMELFIHWQKEQRTLRLESSQEIKKIIDELIEPFQLHRRQMFEIQMALRHVGAELITTALIDDLEANIAFIDDDNINGDSVRVFADNIPNYLEVAKKPEPEKTLYIVKGRLVRMFGLSPTEARSELYDIQQALEENGYSPQEIADILYSKIRFLIGVSNTIYDWHEKKDNFISSIECK